MRVELVTVPAGAYIADYSSQSAIDQFLSEDQYAGAARYTRPLNPHAPKWLLLAERDRLHAARRTISLVYESYQTRPLSGAAAGRVDALAAIDFAIGVDYPDRAPIMAAVDINTLAGRFGNWGLIAAYLLGFADTIDESVFGPGVYGDYEAIELLRDRSVLNWQMGARSFSASRIHPLAHLLQFPESWVGHGLDHYDGPHSTAGVDSNLCLRPFTAWLPTETPDPEPRPIPLPIPNESEPDMPSEHQQTIRDSRFSVVLLVGVGTPEWLTSERLKALSDVGVPGPFVCAPHPSFLILAARAGITDLGPYTL